MSAATHHVTAVEDRIPFHLKIVYGFGAFVNNTLAAAIGGMVIVLNLGFGMSPALVGLLGALPRLTDAITDPLMGYISDNTRSRWGRRRPYIFVGAIAAGVIFAVLWQLPAGRSENFYFWYFLGGSLIFYLAYTIYATPWVALGYELTPDYHERTRLMGVQNFIGNIAYMISPYFLAIMYNERLFDNVTDGAAGLALIIAVFVVGIGILPAIFLRERYKPPVDDDAAEDGGAVDRTQFDGLSPAELDERMFRAAVGTEADYYLPKALAESSGDPVGFNWSAFFLSAFWLIYRKFWSVLALFLPAAGAYLYALRLAQTYLREQSEYSDVTFFAIGIAFWAMSLLPAIALGLFANRMFIARARKIVATGISGGLDPASAFAGVSQRGGSLFKQYPGIESFFSGFSATLRFAPFRKLCIATFLVFNGFILIASFQSYVIIYYVFSGDATEGSEYVGHSGLLQAVTALAVIGLVTLLATKIGKRRAFFVSTGVSMVGYALKWFCYTPDNPWLVLVPAPLMAFGLAGLFTLMPSMIADVVDFDELKTKERREGMYGSIYWWVVKLGQALAILMGGLMLEFTGFDVALGGNQTAEAIQLMRLFDAFVPCIASAIAIWAIASYSITEEKAYSVRKELEARRGAA
ncbi:MAG: MFS transporter [Pseudomonadota bacterium]